MRQVEQLAHAPGVEQRVAVQHGLVARCQHRHQRTDRGHAGQLRAAAGRMDARRGRGQRDGAEQPHEQRQPGQRQAHEQCRHQPERPDSAAQRDRRRQQHRSLQLLVHAQDARAGQAGHEQHTQQGGGQRQAQRQHLCGAAEHQDGGRQRRHQQGRSDREPAVGQRRPHARTSAAPGRQISAGSQSRSGATPRDDTATPAGQPNVKE